MSRLQQFLALESAGVVVLCATTALALILANSPLGPLYTRRLDIPMAIEVDGLLQKNRCCCGSMMG
jgi:Na+/H+ antiporter NhaA